MTRKEVEMIRRCWAMNKEIAIEGGKRTTLVIYWPNKWQMFSGTVGRYEFSLMNSWILLGDFLAECYNYDLAFYSCV